MASKIDHLSDCENVPGTCDDVERSHRICSRCTSSRILNNDDQSIADRLQNLPEIKASKSFDQRMAAAFAMELQKETMQRNRSWLKKHPQISLPDISTDLTKNLF